MTEGGRVSNPTETVQIHCVRVSTSPGTCRASSGFLPARRAATDGVASGWVNRHDLLRFADQGQQVKTRVSSRPFVPGADPVNGRGSNPREAFVRQRRIRCRMRCSAALLTGNERDGNVRPGDQ